MRVLIVEDDRKISTYLKRGLEEQGYAVDLAFTGREALAWAEVVPFDLIVLDLMLPEMDGIAVCHTLRSRGHPAAILMLTARDAIDDRVTGLDAGADDYLVKPFELKELLARLRALARRQIGQPARRNLLQIADLVMDTRTRRVMRAETLIDLTAKEYAVLECLMREPEHILTRTEIAEAVWNYDVYNQSNVVDVYIRNLRRKIDDPFALKLIHTVRGAGYRLSAQSGDE
ncbi:MAG: response regulator transcription factor [Anaerolineae bacterium]|nr:response regulator transcription factor [Anaerolineae bacterium]